MKRHVDTARFTDPCYVVLESQWDNHIYPDVGMKVLTCMWGIITDETQNAVQALTSQYILRL